MVSKLTMIVFGERKTAVFISMEKKMGFHCSGIPLVILLDAGNIETESKSARMKITIPPATRL